LGSWIRWGRPYYVNQQGIQLLGKGVDPNVTPDQLAEVYQVYLAGTDQNCSSEMMPIVRALKGERTRTDDLEIHQGETIIPIEAWGTPVFDEHGNVAYAIVAFQDITERKRSEKLLADYNRTLEQQVAERTAALQQSEAELQALFAAMPDPLLVVDAEGRILRATPIQSEKLSKSIDEQVGQTLSEIFERSQANTFLGCIRQALSTQQPLTVEYSLIVGGRKTWFATRIAPISEHSVIWLARDITDRKRAEEASILEERNHIAREIHDTLAQAFTGIIIHTRSASNEVMADPEKAQTLLTQILDLARSGLAEARRSVEALHRPYLLESSNLQDALSSLTAQLNSSIATQIIYEVIGTTYSLSSDLENNLFRIGQEALTNAIKYAEAHEIRIELVYEPTPMQLTNKRRWAGI
jgi:PAS domain S-box-containing protein